MAEVYLAEDENVSTTVIIYCYAFFLTSSLLSLQENSKSLLQQEAHLLQEAHMKQQEEEEAEEEEEEEEEYEVQQADIIREAASLDDMAKLITVEEVRTSSGLPPLEERLRLTFVPVLLLTCHITFI